MATPIYNPVIPCVHPIPGGMYPGRMIRVQGNVPPGAQRFAINFQCGANTDPRDDIALHLNFRFVEMCVVRNHLTAMSWGVEETNGGMPLSRGEAFEALILCEPQSIKVALNGVHFCEFAHRVPYQRISHITIDGDVHVQFMGFEGAQPPQMFMVNQHRPVYRAEPPAYGAYGAPPPAYGAPGYGAPQAAGYAPPAAPGGYQPSYVQQQQRGGMGTGAAVGLGVGALAAGGLAGYALGGGFSSDSPSSEGYATYDTAGVADYSRAPYPEAPSAPQDVPAPTAADETRTEDDDYLENDTPADVPAITEEREVAPPEDDDYLENDNTEDVDERENEIPEYTEEAQEDAAEPDEDYLENDDEN